MEAFPQSTQLVYPSKQSKQKKWWKSWFQNKPSKKSDSKDILSTECDNNLQTNTRGSKKWFMKALRRKKNSYADVMKNSKPQRKNKFLPQWLAKISKRKIKPTSNATHNTKSQRKIKILGKRFSKLSIFRRNKKHTSGPEDATYNPRNETEESAHSKQIFPPGGDSNRCDFVEATECLHDTKVLSAFPTFKHLKTEETCLQLEVPIPSQGNQNILQDEVGISNLACPTYGVVQQYVRVLIHESDKENHSFATQIPSNEQTKSHDSKETSIIDLTVGQLDTNVSELWLKETDLHKCDNLVAWTDLQSTSQNEHYSNACELHGTINEHHDVQNECNKGAAQIVQEREEFLKDKQTQLLPFEDFKDNLGDGSAAVIIEQSNDESNLHVIQHSSNDDICSQRELSTETLSTSQESSLSEGEPWENESYKSQDSGKRHSHIHSETSSGKRKQSVLSDDEDDQSSLVLIPSKSSQSLDDIQENRSVAIQTNFKRPKTIESLRRDRNVSSLGIKGANNSCYADTLLFALFAFCDKLDFLLETSLSTDIRQILINEIVNPLRNDSFAKPGSVQKLRNILARVNESFRNQMMDAEELALTLFKDVLDFPGFIYYDFDVSDYIHQVFVSDGDGSFGCSTQFPTVQWLLERSFTICDVRLIRLPSPIFLVKLPVSNGKRLFAKMFPNPRIQINNLMQENADKEITYTLRSVVCLSGYHYTCFVKTQVKGKWVFHDSMGVAGCTEIGDFDKILNSVEMNGKYHLMGKNNNAWLDRLLGTSYMCLYEPEQLEVKE